MKNALAALLLLTLVAGSAFAGTLSPGLQQQIQFLNGDEEVRVLVVMKDQVDVRALDWQLHDAKAGRELRHQRVVGDLQTIAKESQNDLLVELSSKAGGDVRGFTSHWLINSVFVVTTVDHVRELAKRADVDVIEADLHVELIEPIKSDKPAADKSAKGIGLTPGLDAINAPPRVGRAGHRRHRRDRRRAGYRRRRTHPL